MWCINKLSMTGDNSTEDHLYLVEGNNMVHQEKPSRTVVIFKQKIVFASVKAIVWCIKKTKVSAENLYTIILL